MRLILKFCLLLGAAGMLAQTSNQEQQGQARPLRDALYNNEQKLAAAETKQDKSFFERALDDQLIYVAYNGLVFTKSKIIESLRYIDVNRYSVENMKVRSVGQNAGLVTYDLLLNGSIAGHDLPGKQYASSVWLRRGGKWLLVFHQTTPAHHE